MKQNIVDNDLARPIFESVFGEDWDKLPPAMKRRYGVRPSEGDITRMHGHLTISMSKIVRPFKPLMRAIGLLIPMEGKFPTRVDFETYKDNPHTHLIRNVELKNGQFAFNSRWIQHNNEVIEILAGWICWRASYRWCEDHIEISHKGYAIKFGKYIIPFPVTWLFGRGDAQEIPLSEDSFAMWVSISHSIFGEMYRYEGEFKLEAHTDD